MSNIVLLLESIGQDASCQGGDTGAIERAIAHAGVGLQAGVAILAGDQARLESLTGCKPVTCCAMFPAKKDDEEEEEPGHDDDEIVANVHSRVVAQAI